MGRYDKGFSSLFTQLSDELEHVFTIARIEVAGWLVGNHKRQNAQS